MLEFDPSKRPNASDMLVDKWIIGSLETTNLARNSIKSKTRIICEAKQN